MAFLLTPFCRCAASLSNEARCEDAENNDVTIQDGAWANRSTPEDGASKVVQRDHTDI